MALKLKLKIGSRTPVEPEEREKPLPKIRIKPPIKQEPSDGISKPKHKREKLKKLKLSLGRSLTPAASESHSAPAAPVIPKRVPKVRIKPTRIPGEGYDSEAPDVEDDPLIEQGIVVRFANDVNLDFVHNALDTGDFTNVNIKWITRDKAVVNVNLTLYSARLIDLPTLTELYKTVDKKNIFKTIDISQILLVLHQINPKQLNMDTDFEVPADYTYVHPLYKLSVNKEIRNTKTVFNHGLAYAYEDVYRRFKPRKTNPRVMADIELRVDELVRLDQELQESHYEYVDAKSINKFNTLSRSHTPTLPATPSHRTDSTENAEEEEDDQMALDLEADIDNVLEQELAEALDLTSNTTAATVLMKSEFDNEDEQDDELVDQADDDEGDDEDDDDDDDDDEEEDDDEDEDTKQDKSRVKKLEEEISDLERAADKQKVLLATASFKMMRMKFQSAYNNLKGQLDQKKRELVKIREQQQKQKMVPTGPKNNEEEDDEEDEDEEENDENDENEETEPNQDHEAAEPELGSAAEDNDDDIDDFQGLF